MYPPGSPPPGYPPGYTPPGMAYAPPTAPGMFSTAGMALGWHGAGNIDQGVNMFGAQAGTAFAATPAAAIGMAGSGVMAAGAAGMFLNSVATTRRWQAAGSVLSRLGSLDPFTAAFNGMSRGWGMGGALGMRMGGRVLMAGAMGTGAGALMYGGWEAAKYTANQLTTGAQAYGAGRALMSQMSPSVTLGGQGGQAGGLHDVASAADMSMQELSSVTKQLQQVGSFQNTSNIREFKEALKTSIKAVKEISEAMKTSMEEATQVLGTMRRQGIYSPEKAAAEARRVAGTAAAGGISESTVMGLRDHGASVARQHGLRGRYGADLANTLVGNVAVGMRTGRLSEELVEEMGGVEGATAQLTGAYAGFLGSSRGRAMIAASMTNKKFDPSKLQGLLGSNVENIVLKADAAGLGAISAAGGREAKQDAMQYAGLMMVSMADAQNRELGWSSNKKNLTRMLGTMGLSSDQSELLLGSLASQREATMRELRETNTASNRASWDSEYESSRYMGRFSRAMHRTAGGGLQRMGARMYEGGSGVIEDFSSAWTGRAMREGGLGKEGRALLRSESAIGAASRSATKEEARVMAMYDRTNAVMDEAHLAKTGARVSALDENASVLTSDQLDRLDVALMSSDGIQKLQRSPVLDKARKAANLMFLGRSDAMAVTDIVLGGVSNMMSSEEDMVANAAISAGVVRDRREFDALSPEKKQKIHQEVQQRMSTHGKGDYLTRLGGNRLSSQGDVDAAVNKLSQNLASITGGDASSLRRILNKGGEAGKEVEALLKDITSGDVGQQKRALRSVMETYGEGSEMHTLFTKMLDSSGDPEKQKQLQELLKSSGVGKLSASRAAIRLTDQQLSRQSRAFQELDKTGLGDIEDRLRIAAEAEGANRDDALMNLYGAAATESDYSAIRKVFGSGTLDQVDALSGKGGMEALKGLGLEGAAAEKLAAAMKVGKEGSAERKQAIIQAMGESRLLRGEVWGSEDAAGGADGTLVDKRAAQDEKLTLFLSKFDELAAKYNWYDA